MTENFVAYRLFIDYSLIIGNNQWVINWLPIDYPLITHWFHWCHWCHRLVTSGTEQECKLSQIRDAGCAAVTICTLSTHAYLFSNKMYNCSQGIVIKKKTGWIKKKPTHLFIRNFLRFLVAPSKILVRRCLQAPFERSLRRFLEARSKIWWHNVVLWSFPSQQQVVIYCSDDSWKLVILSTNRWHQKLHSRIIFESNTSPFLCQKWARSWLSSS